MYSLQPEGWFHLLVTILSRFFSTAASPPSVHCRCLGCAHRKRMSLCFLSLRVNINSQHALSQLDRMISGKLQPGKCIPKDIKTSHWESSFFFFFFFYTHTLRKKLFCWVSAPDFKVLLWTGIVFSAVGTNVNLLLHVSNFLFPRSWS